MDRRTFLKATGACAAATATATAATTSATASTHTMTAFGDSDGGSVESSEILNELRLHFPWPDNLAGPSDQARRLIQNIRSVSNDRLKITPDQPKSPSDSQASDSDADLFFGVLHTRETAPGASLYFSGLPQHDGLSASNLESWLTLAGGQPLWDDLFADMEIKPILAGHLGEMPGLWSKKPIHSVADLSGKKIAITSTIPDVMRTIGAVPVFVPSFKLQSALADDSIDVVEYGGFQSAMSIGLHKVAKHTTLGLLNPDGTALALTLPLSLWHRLSESDKAIFTTCANQSYRLAVVENRALQMPLATALRDHHGVTVHTLERKNAKSWQAITDTFLAHISSSNERAQRINASYSAFKNLSV